MGVILTDTIPDPPPCYAIDQLLIGERFQNKGYATSAIEQIMAEFSDERAFDNVEICVKKDNAAAIHLYEKFGFADSGYIDPDEPDSVCMVKHL